MIHVRNLTKRFGSQIAVESISFDVLPAENLVILGTSGCGKTTTLKMLNRLIEPTEGHIEINGIDIRQQDGPMLRRGIGYVVQESGLFPHYSVRENISVVPRLLNWPPNQIQQRITELLTTLRLPDSLLDRYPSELSGGQRQRVGLARALAVRPPVVLMDEPFGALDPYTRRHIRQELFGLEELQKTTVVLVTHDVQEAIEIADHIMLMDQGRIVQMGSPTEFKENPTTDFVNDFFGW